MRLFIDMDGPLVDLEGGAARLHGVSPGEFARRRKPGVWDDVEAYGCTTSNEWWEKIHIHGESFWFGLEKQPWADDLIRLASSITSDWYVLTAPSRDRSSYAGKLAWWQAKMDHPLDKIIVTRHKHLFANGPKALLIDDREENVEAFKAAGGDAIVFPTIGNSYYEYRHDPLNYIRHLLH